MHTRRVHRPRRHAHGLLADQRMGGRLAGPLYGKYFHEDGIAVHGYDDIPTSPASHGCARFTFAAIDDIWANGLMPMDSTVLVYGESPPP